MGREYSKADIRDIAEDLVEELRDLDDGTKISTRELAEQNWYDDLDEDDLFELDDALRRAAKANKITLDMSAHKGLEEGLPFNLSFIVKNKRAQIKCPRCGSIHTARYLYGMPAFNEEMKRKLDAGRLVLGGCCVSFVEVDGEEIYDMPKRFCNDCKKDFQSPPIIYKKEEDKWEDFRDIVTQIKFEIGGFLGRSKVVIKRKDEGAIVHTEEPFFIKKIDPENPIPYGDKQIRPDKWRRIVSKLFDEMYVHEWKKHYYPDEPVEDGEQWELTIRFEGRRGMKISGDNAYPPYWPELKKIFREYIDF